MLRAIVLLAASLNAIDPGRMLSTATSSFSEDDEGEFRSALERLSQANTLVNNDPEKHLEALANAIARVESFPALLARDSAASELLDLATLNLVRALLRAERSAEAADTMDALLRRTAQVELPVQKFGPTLVRFHKQRSEQLRKQGTARLEIECEVECEILLDRHYISRRSGPLYLGTYDVTIVATDGSREPEQQTVELVGPGELVELHYPIRGIAETPKAPTAALQLAPRRFAPRWAEVLLTVLGASAIGAGGYVLSIDGHCTDGVPAVDDNGLICPRVYETSALGAAVLGLGAVTMTSGIVLLSVDEAQAKSGQRGTQAMLHYRVRF